VSRSDGAGPIDDGGAFPPFRHQRQGPLARHLLCWSLCELQESSSGGLRVAPGRRPPALELGRVRPEGRMDRRTSSRFALDCGRETSLRSQHTALTVGRGSATRARRQRGRHTKRVTAPRPRHGEDRLEGTSQRPYPLSSSAASPRILRSRGTSLYLRSPSSRAVEARARGWVSRPVEGLSPPTNPWRSLAVASRERSFLPWVYSPLRGSPPMIRCESGLPLSRSHCRFRRSPGPGSRQARTCRPGQRLSGPSALCSR
jgi:hypothetical protein